MLIRGAMAVMFALTLHQPVRADLHHSDRCGVAPAPAPAPDVQVCRPDMPLLEGEAVGTQGSLRIILRQIAIYASIGNRHGAEILISQLRSQGVSEEVLGDALNWTKLHGPPSPAPSEPRTPPQVDHHWEATQ